MSTTFAPELLLLLLLLLLPLQKYQTFSLALMGIRMASSGRSTTKHSLEKCS